MLSDEGRLPKSFSCLRAMAFHLPISHTVVQMKKKKLRGVQPNKHSSDSPSGECPVEEAPKEFQCRPTIWALPIGFARWLLFLHPPCGTRQ